MKETIETIETKEATEVAEAKDATEEKDSKEAKKQNDKITLGQKILTAVGIVLCVILTPMLIINCILLIKGWTNQDEMPSFASVAPMITLSGSMEDEFPVGSMIFIKTMPASEIKEGDIIAYFDPASRSNSVVTHKVRFIKTTEAGETVFYTYGTANINKDFEDIAEYECEAIPSKHLIGRYTGFHIKELGNVALFMQTTQGFILCVFVPLILLVAYDIIRRKLYEKKHEGDKDELLRELQELRELKTQAMAVVAKSETMRPTSPAAPAPVKTPTPTQPSAPVKKPAPVQKKTKELTEADFEIEDT